MGCVSEWGWSGELGDGSDPGEDSGECLRPGPMGGEPQDELSGPVDDASGDGDELGAERSGDAEPFWSGGVCEVDGPADEVVGQNGGGEPGSVGGEMPGREVGESGSFFEVADGEFNDGVLAVLGVEMLVLVLLSDRFAAAAPLAGAVTGGDIRGLSIALFSDYLLPFEVASVILLVALVGAIVLARKEHD